MSIAVLQFIVVIFEIVQVIVVTLVVGCIVSNLDYDWTVKIKAVEKFLKEVIEETRKALPHGRAKNDIKEKFRKARETRLRRNEEDLKAAVRREKEESARIEGFFGGGGSYARGFDADGLLIHRGRNVPPAKAFDYYQKLDDLGDTQLFFAFSDNSKEV